MSNAAAIPPNDRHQRQEMLTLLPHQGHGAKSMVEVEKEIALKTAEKTLPAVLFLTYRPDKHTVDTNALNAYFELMAQQIWTSVSDFTHTAAADLYDHALPVKLTLQVEAEHNGLFEAVEAKYKQPKHEPSA